MTVRGWTLGGSSAAVAAVLLLAGCGSSTPSATSPTTAVTGTTPSGALPNGLRTHSTGIGTVLASPSGRTVYELVGATPSSSKCTGSCLSVWPPVKVNGQQVTVNGHPAYLFAGDAGPGETNGQGLKDKWGKWWALDPAGNPIELTGGTTTTTSGYGY